MGARDSRRGFGRPRPGTVSNWLTQTSRQPQRHNRAYETGTRWLCHISPSLDPPDGGPYDATSAIGTDPEDGVQSDHARPLEGNEEMATTEKKGRPPGHPENRPIPNTAAAAKQTSRSMPPTVQQDPAIAALIGLSDERDRHLELRMEAWRAGCRVRAAALRDQYELGILVGIGLLKRSQHEVADELAQEMVRWGGRREDFGRPRPGDYQGGSLPLEHPGEVWLGGPSFHWYGRCTSACRSYHAGWYGPAEVVAILRTLPHDYEDEIARLGDLARCAA